VFRVVDGSTETELDSGRAETCEQAMAEAEEAGGHLAVSGAVHGLYGASAGHVGQRERAQFAARRRIVRCKSSYNLG
jgi:hypothetical protein